MLCVTYKPFMWSVIMLNVIMLSVVALVSAEYTNINNKTNSNYIF